MRYQLATIVLLALPIVTIPKMALAGGPIVPVVSSLRDVEKAIQQAEQNKDQKPNPNPEPNPKPEPNPNPEPDNKETEAEKDDPAKIADRIANNSKSAVDRLAMNDPGKETQNVQEKILRDIDKLLNQPPPPPMGGGGGGGMPPPMSGDMPPPMGGNQPMSQKPMGGQKPMPMGGNQPMPMPMGGNQPMPMPMGQQPMPMGQQPMGGNQPGIAGQTTPKQIIPLDDRVVKEVWGHLPPNLRQKMNQYYQEQFMPRYSDMLKQYYAELAEREKKK